MSATSEASTRAIEWELIAVTLLPGPPGMTRGSYGRDIRSWGSRCASGPKMMPTNTCAVQPMEVLR